MSNPSENRSGNNPTLENNHSGVSDREVTREEKIVQEEFEGLDNDLVNIDQFAASGLGDDGLTPVDADTDQQGLPNEPAIEDSNTLQKP